MINPDCYAAEARKGDCLGPVRSIACRAYKLMTHQAMNGLQFVVLAARPFPGPGPINADADKFVLQRWRAGAGGRRRAGFGEGMIADLSQHFCLTARTNTQ